MTTAAGWMAWTAFKISSSDVSAKISKCGCSIPSRCPRILICLGDSSPETYRTGSVLDARRGNACRSRVVFPIPGISADEDHGAGNHPSPSTRSNSPMRVRRRSSPTTSISPMGVGLACADLHGGRTALAGLGLPLFLHGVPATAVRTPAQPPRGLMSARLAGKDGLCFHGLEAPTGGVTALIIEESVE